MHRGILTALASQRPIDPLEVVPEYIVCSSQPSNWPHITVWLSQSPPLKQFALYVPPTTKHTVFIQCNAGPRLVQERGGQIYEGVWEVGDILIAPAGQPRGWYVEGTIHTLHIDVEPRFLQDVASEDYGVPLGHVALRDVFGTRDSRLEYLGKRLLVELETGGMGGSVCVEELTRRFVGHLVQTYSIQALSECAYKGGLPPQKLRRVQEYICTYLHRQLTLQELAALVPMSPRHFIRAFRRSTGFTPHQYVTHCRIEQAKVLLRNPRLRIADVATQVGFQRQEHFTRHFRIRTSMTPTAYRGMQCTRQ